MCDWLDAWWWCLTQPHFNESMSVKVNSDLYSVFSCSRRSGKVNVWPNEMDPSWHPKVPVCLHWALLVTVIEMAACPDVLAIHGVVVRSVLLLVLSGNPAWGESVTIPTSPTLPHTKKAIHLTTPLHKHTLHYLAVIDHNENIGDIPQKIWHMRWLVNML